MGNWANVGVVAVEIKSFGLKGVGLQQIFIAWNTWNFQKLYRMQGVASNSTISFGNTGGERFVASDPPPDLAGHTIRLTFQDGAALSGKTEMKLEVFDFGGNPTPIFKLDKIVSFVGFLVAGFTVMGDIKEIGMTESFMDPDLVEGTITGKDLWGRMLQ